MDNSLVLYSLPAFILSLLFFLNGAAFRKLAKMHFEGTNEYARQSDIVGFQEQLKMAKGTGKRHRVDQVRSEQPGYMSRYLISQVSFGLAGISIIGAFIMHTQGRSGQGLVAGVVSLGAIDLILIILALLSNFRAAAAFNLVKGTARKEALRVFNHRLSSARESDDKQEVQELKEKQPLFCYYDDRCWTTIVAACSVFIPFAIGLLLIFRP